MSANLGNSAVAAEVEKISFSFQFERRAMPKTFQYNCSHFTCQQSFAQNSSSYTKTVCETRTSRCTSWVSKRQRNQKSVSIPKIMEKTKKFQKNIYFYFTDNAKAFDCVDHRELWNILKEKRVPEYHTKKKPACGPRSSIKNQMWND